MNDKLFAKGWKTNKNVIVCLLHSSTTVNSNAGKNNKKRYNKPQRNNLDLLVGVTVECVRFYTCLVQAKQITYKFK